MPKRILVVEDDDDLRLALYDSLSRLSRDCADAGMRLSHALLSLSSMIGKETPESVKIPFALNRSFLAHAIGATPETTGHLMSQLRVEGCSSIPIARS
ncbi:helix-turn-helix domain-containing protein [Petrachloros mirabilis]